MFFVVGSFKKIDVRAVFFDISRYRNIQITQFQNILISLTTLTSRAEIWRYLAACQVTADMSELCKHIIISRRGVCCCHYFNLNCELNYEDNHTFRLIKTVNAQQTSTLVQCNVILNEFKA